MTRDDYATAAHRGRVAYHSWGPPPPGSGRLPVCNKCGERKTMETESDFCEGGEPTQERPTEHEFSPIR